MAGMPNKFSRWHEQRVLLQDADIEDDAEVLALRHPDPREALRAAYALAWDAAPPRAALLANRPGRRTLPG